MPFPIIDTNHNTMKSFQRMHASGVQSVIRYFSRAMGDKVIRKAELEALLKDGFRVGIVYEGAGDKLSVFSYDMGFKDAAFARDYGAQIGVPGGAAIYFAVDFDATANQINHQIVDYFRGVGGAFALRGPASYRVGVYGSGMVCKAIKDTTKLAGFSWVSCSMGWTGSRAYAAGNTWNLIQRLPMTVAGLDVDPDVANPAYPDWGDFGRIGVKPVAVAPAAPDTAPAVAANTAASPAPATTGVSKWLWALLSALFERK